MIINHNCCIRLVPLVIFIYDARSHIHQTYKKHVFGRTSVIYFMCMYLLQHVICIIVFDVFEHSNIRRVKLNLKRFHLGYFRKLKPVVSCLCKFYTLSARRIFLMLIRAPEM